MGAVQSPGTEDEEWAVRQCVTSVGGRRFSAALVRAVAVWENESSTMSQPVRFRQIAMHHHPRSAGPSLQDVFDVVHPRIRNATLQAAEALKQAGVRYALVGGLAVGVHGYPRATKDVDFLVGDETFHDSTARVVVPRVQLPYQIDNVAVDYIPVPIGAEFLDAVLDRPLMCDGVPVAPVEVIVFMKLSSPRAKDNADVVELIKAGADLGAVREYLDAHATEELRRRFETAAQRAAAELADEDA